MSRLKPAKPQPQFNRHLLTMALASLGLCSSFAVWSAEAPAAAADAAARVDAAEAGAPAPQDAAAPVSPAAPSGAAHELDAVQVTGNRRVQSIQKYAGTIQSFSGEDLTKLGINTDFRNLQAVVPGLQITKQEGKYEIFLRGIGAADSDFSSDPSVATYYNGIYLPRPRSIGPMFFDVDRIEVNKGPQGTVRGRNATGGSINVISKRPELGVTSGGLKIGAGNYDFTNAEGVLNLPIGETFALRAALFDEERSSYISNGYPKSLFDAEGPSALDNQAARLSMLWEPNDKFSAYVMLDKVTERGTGDPGLFAERGLSAGYDIKDLDDPFKQYFRTQGQTTNDIEGIAGTFTYAFNDKVSVELSTSFRKYDFYNRNASREWQLGPVYPGSEREAYFNPERLDWYDTFYQADKSSSNINELRFFGDTGRVIWSAGLFNYQEKYDYVSWDVGNGYFGDCDWWRPGTVCGYQDGLGGENRGDNSKVESNAAYGDFSFAATDSLRLIGGIRYTRDKKIARESNIKYQFIVPEELFAQFTGQPINTATNPYTTGLILGSPGFRLAPPGHRRGGDPSICTGWSPADLRCGPGGNTLDYFLGGIQNFGAQDNWAQFLQNNRDQIQVIARSDFPGGKSEDIYEDSYVDWRVGFEYDVNPQVMVYGTVSTGTRSGGINRPLLLNDGSALAPSFEPEELTSYEAGIKGDYVWGETPLRLNASVFYYDYKNKVLQNLIDVPAPTPTNPNATSRQVFNDNAANASVLGLELEGRVGLPHGFNLGYNFTYLDATFDQSNVLDTRSGGLGLIVPLDGNRLPNTSKYNANVSLSQTIDIGRGALSSFDWTINLTYRSDYYLTAFNSRGFGLDGNGRVIEIPLRDMPFNNGSNPAAGGGPANGLAMRDDVDGFLTVNVSAGLNFGSDNQFRIDGFVSNLTDEVYSGKGFVNNSTNIRYLNTPRMYGLRFSSQF